MRSDTSQMPMWLGAELKLIEDVPVHLCDTCNTQAFDPGVEAAIRALVATGFPDRLASREVVVPVFQLDDFLVDNNKKVAAE
jgi:YgiT-type zinc finger domain-containing protein